jgi:competence protein ComFC
MIKEVFVWILQTLLPQKCVVCGNVQESKVCQACVTQLKTAPHLHTTDTPFKVYYFFLYKGPIKTLLHHIKFNQKKDIALQVSTMMKSFPLPPHITSDVIIIPIPSHPKRIKDRGFNHVTLLFSPFLAHHGLRLTSVLKRVKHTKPLFSLTESARTAEIKNAFTLLDDTLIKDKKILLIDDILTSGSTLSEVATLLKEKGASSIEGLTLAYTPL